LTDEKGKQWIYAYVLMVCIIIRQRLAFSNPFTFVGEYGVKDEGEGFNCRPTGIKLPTQPALFHNPLE
jgi:hypothetical protein